MKVFAFLSLFISTSLFACDIQEIRKDVFSHFKTQIAVESSLGEQKAVSTLKEMSLTDSLMRIRGEEFFITKLVFDILWANGIREEREILMAALVDRASCRIESFESGDILGSTTSSL